MATNEYNYHPADLLGNVAVPRLSLPTIRSSLRRSDADGVSTVPYYPGINTKKLTLEYTDNALVVQTVTITITTTDYQSLINAITALDPTNLQAIDMGGFLGIRNVNAGETHYIKILPQGVSVDEAAGLLGLVTDPFPGSISYAGELASTPAHRSQQNPQGATLISKGDDLQADAFNRAFVSVIREIEKLRADLERDTIGYIDVNVTVQNHEISSSVKGFYYNDTLVRLPIRNIDPATAFGSMEGYVTLLDPVTKREVYNGAEKVQALRIHYASAVTALDTSSGFATWGTPDGGHIYDAAIPTKTKHASVAITEIKGSVVRCTGATFVSRVVQKNDLILISGATNTSPYDHNGWFAVVEVLDQEHLRVRPLGSNENFPAVGPTATPFAINPTGSGFGNLAVYFGDFVPAVNMFVSLQNGAGLANGSYIARIATGRSFREPQVEKFQSNGDPSAAISAHVNVASNAHAATAIGGFTSATTWNDGTTITGANLKATIEDILTDLRAQTGAGGSAKVGSPLLTAVGFTVPKTLAAGSVSSQLLSALNQLQTHETDANFHPAYGVVSGFGQTSFASPNLTMAGGTLVASYLGQVREFVVTGQVFSLAGNQLYYIYVDLTDGVMKITQTEATAFAATAVPLWYLFTQGVAITWSRDWRIPLSTFVNRSKGFVTVGPTGSDFPTIEAALEWVNRLRAGTLGGTSARTMEILVTGNVTMDSAMPISYPIIIRGIAVDNSGTPLCKITVAPGTFSHQINGSFQSATVPTGLNKVTFKDLHFVTPITTVTTSNPTIGIDAQGYEISNWLIDNCVFEGGTNAPFIRLQSTGGDFPTLPADITIRNCWFKGTTRTVENPHILISRVNGTKIIGCRFDGSLADTNQTGISIASGTGNGVDTTIENCKFNTGGRHIIISNNADMTIVKHCRFKNSRGSAINHLSTGEVFLDTCIFDNCMTNSSVAEGVIWSDGVSGRLDLKGCRFKNWVTGLAIRALTNTSAGSRVVNCVFTSTVAGRAVAGLSHALFQGNDFDPKVGATSGNGFDTPMVLSVGANCRIISNAFRNCGSTATSGTNTVMAFNGNCIINSNSFTNCRGTLMAVSGDNCIIDGNVADDVGAAATDVGVQLIGSNKCVINGNVMTHTTNGQHFNIAGDLNAHIHGNALTNAPTVSPSGLAGNAVWKYTDIVVGATGSIAAGATVVKGTLSAPPETFGVWIPLQLHFCGKSGNIESGIRFVYDDGTTEDTFNSNASTTIMPIGPGTAGMSQNIPTNASNNKVIVSVQVVVRNTGGAPESQTLSIATGGRFWYIG